jgi:hypothetical protein
MWSVLQQLLPPDRQCSTQSLVVHLVHPFLRGPTLPEVGVCGNPMMVVVG